MRCVRASLLALVVIGCSSSTTAPPGPVNPCGAGPYVRVDGTVREFQVGPYRPKEGMKISTDLCPSLGATTDANGKVTIHVPKGKPFVTRFDHPDDVPMLFPEWQLDADFVGETAVIPTSYQSLVLPEFAADKAMIGFGVFTGAADAGPCSTADGITYAIPGQPQATITYLNADPVPKPDPALTATSKNGIASVTFATEVTVEPTATKAGCTLVSKHDGFTGRAVLQKGRFVQFFFVLSN